MYKVLLADDEILDLEGMRTFIPWDKLGMEVVGAVTNGFSACEVIDKHPVDVLVTDIRMPNMTGLELAKKALSRRQHLRVIFVSGYQDFHYVKQAMSLNACSYVLKPMDDEELIDSLTKVREELDADKKRRQTETAFKQIVPIAKNEYLLQLLDGSYHHSVLQILLDQFGLDDLEWPVSVATLEIDDLHLQASQTDVREQAVHNGEYLSFVMDVCREHHIRHFCKLNKRRIALLLNDTRVLEDIGAIANAHAQPFSVTSGIGNPVSGLSQLQHSYRQSLEALALKMFYGKGTILVYRDIKTDEIEDVKTLDIQLDSLFSAIANYELERIRDELIKLYDHAVSLRSAYTIHNFTMFIIMKLDNYLHTIGEDLFQLLGLNLKELDQILRFETIEEIHSWLRRKIYELSELLHGKKQNRNWKLVQEIIHHLQERLHENITLKQIADKYSFSPNYLGLLFKEATNKNFSDYIIMLRMEKAKDLLTNTHMKNYEIAAQIGYRYLPYFSRQFKEYFGMTPMEYRRKR